MIKTFENFATRVVEWTPDKQDKNIFFKLAAREKKWLKVYADFGLITRMLKIDDNFNMWLNDGRVYTTTIVDKGVDLEFIDKDDWQKKSGLEAQYNVLKKQNLANVADFFDHAMSTTSYNRLITELGLVDITNETERKNGTFVFQTNRLNNHMFRKNDPVIYKVYARGDVTYEDGWMPANINRKRIQMQSWRDYIPMFDLVYEKEKQILTKKGLLQENKEEEEEFEKEMENSDDFIPNDILKHFSQEDQLMYALHTHPDHDFYMFVGRPGYKDVIVNGKKYKEEILEIETLVKIETADDAKVSGMMKMRATSQGQNSRLYGIWLPKGIFDDDAKHIYGSEIPDFMLPLIDQHKKPI